MAEQQYNFQNETVKVDPTKSSAINTGTGINNQVISVDQLKPVVPINNLPTPDYSSITSSANSLAAGAEAYAKLFKPTDATYTADKVKADVYTSSIDELLGLKAGKGAEQLRMEQEAGLQQKNQQLANLQGEIGIGNAEYAKISADLSKSLVDTEGKVVPIGEIVGQQRQAVKTAAVLQTAKAADIAIKVAQAQALQGNIVASQNSINRAIDLKYSAIDTELDTRKYQLDTIYDKLNKAEQKQADAMKLAIADQKQALEDKKEKERQVSDIMIKAAQSGADTLTLDKIQKSGSIGEAISLAGNALGAEFKQKIAQQEFENKIQLQKLALDRAQVGISQARLEFEKTKEAFDQAMKLNPKGEASPVMQQALSKSNIDLIGSLATDKALDTAVGPNPLSRGTNFFSSLVSIDNKTGATSNFIAGVEQLRSQLNLDTLIKAKANGATFGALSDQELQVLASAATKLGTWAIKKDGKIIGYDTNEGEFRKELDKINNFAKLDYILKGGNPIDVNVKQQEDGTYWTQNSDGSLTRLE